MSWRCGIAGLLIGLASALVVSVTAASGVPVGVQLRLGDLPRGFRADRSATVTGGDAKLRRCLGVRPVALASSHSPPFEAVRRGHLTIALSFASEMPSRALANDYLAALRARGGRCAALVARRNAPRGQRAGLHVGVSSLRAPVDGAVARRFTLRGGPFVGHAVEYVDLVWMVRGRLVVTLDCAEIARQFPIALESRLSRGLAARAARAS